MSGTSHPQIDLYTDTDTLVRFATVLQSGVQYGSIDAGATIGKFLEGLPGFEPDYINEKVQTIFLNGTATDDLSTPLTGKKIVLAITTAMPGLAGAIFRKNSPHAPLRTTSTKQQSTEQPELIVLKVFSALTRERGPELLKAGVLIKSYDLHSFFHYRPSMLKELKRIELNGSETGREELLTTLENSELVTLTVNT